MDFLIQQIVNLPLGMPCFLCLTMYGQECIWEEIGGEMLLEGNRTKSKALRQRCIVHATICTITIPV